MPVAVVPGPLKSSHLTPKVTQEESTLCLTPQALRGTLLEGVTLFRGKKTQSVV